MRRSIWGALALVIAASPSLAQQQPTLEKGFAAGKAYASGELDSINLFNGNLNLNIPFGQTYQVGGKLSYSFSLSYAGNNWDAVYDSGTLITGQGTAYQTTHNVDRNWTEPYKYSNAGIGWLWSFGRMLKAEVAPATLRIYESPDGGQHVFYPDLHAGNSGITMAHEVVGAVSFTRDGTYIRRTILSDGIKLEFADGSTKEFAADGYLRSYYDRFANRIELERVASSSIPLEHVIDAATCTTSYMAWKITEKRADVLTGRTHYVYFVTRTPEQGREKLEPYAERLCAMRLAAFGGTWATYKFAYSNRPISRQGIITVVAEDPATVSPVVTVPLLTRIHLPDGSTYEVVYDIGQNGSGTLTSNDPLSTPPTMTSYIGSSYTGHVRELTLPTRGGYRWRYRSYWFPTSRYLPNYPGYHPGQGEADKPYRDKSAGVWQRDMFRSDGSTEGTWTYTSTPVTNDPQAKTSKTTLSKPGQATSEHYFNTCRLCGGSEAVAYGLPFQMSDTTKVRDHYLSSVTTLPNGTRKTYVRYEWDAAVADDTSANRRQAGSLTLFEDGTMRQSASSDFDGVSRYKVEETKFWTTVNDAVPELTRKVTTATAPPADITTGTWILDRYTSVSTTDGATTSVTDYCFDALGFLERTRRRRDHAAPRKDLLAVFTSNTTGDVATEAYYGGDHTLLPQDFSTCTGNPGAPAYKLTHTYAHGIRSQTKYDGVSFNSLDLLIDPSTGLASSSSDTAGVTTSFVYDAMGRLTQLRPAESAWSEYTYETANADGAAAVTATQWGLDGTVMTQSRYHYDGFGRLVQESRRMPAATWSTNWTQFDEFGRKVAATTARQTSSGSPAPYPAPAGNQTTWTYDTLGRPVTVSAPDHKQTSYAYPNTRTSTRTASVGTVAAANGAVSETAVTVTEKTDGAGRLVEVVENGESTTYTYDLNDRLSGVHMGDQTRSFTYDGAGFLKEETHPESGKTSYTYDARGHMRTRNPALPDPNGTLTYQYDTAERLGTVSGNAGVLKEFDYHQTAVSGERALGKLRSATRRNRHPLLGAGDMTVKEEYTYAGPGGRISRKTTVVGASPNERKFSDAYHYDALGAVAALTYPTCSGCTGLVTPARRVAFVRDSGLLTQVSGYTTGAGISYHPSGMVSGIQHRNGDGTNGPLYTATDDFGMGRPGLLQVNNYCSAAGTLSVTTAPANTQNLATGTSVTLSVQETGVVTSWQWYERTPTGDILLNGATSRQYGPFAMGATTRSFFVRATADTCQLDSQLITVSSCASGDIAVAGSVTANVATTASFPPVEGATYNWSISNGIITGGAGTASITFVPGCSGQVMLTLSTTNQCGTIVRTASPQIEVPTAALSGSATVATGTVVPLRVDLAGAAPWKVRWSDQPEQDYVINESPHFRQVTAGTAVSYSLTSVKDAADCPGVATGTADVVGTTGCTMPENLKITPSQYTIYSSQASLYAWVTPVEGATYAWTITNGEQTGVSGNRIDFQVGCSGKVTLKVTISTSCATRVVTTEVNIAIAHVESITPASAQYVEGASPVTLTTVVTANKGQITWSDGLRQNIDLRGLNTITRTVAPPNQTTYRIVDLRDRNGCVGKLSTASAVVTVCKQPDATVTAPSAIAAIGEATASVPAAGAGSSYSWSVEGGEVIDGQNSALLRYKARCTGPVKVTATVTNACGATNTSTAFIAVNGVSASATGSVTIAQGASATISAVLTGTGPWSVRWNDEAQAVTVAASPYNRIVNPSGTTTYSVASVSGAGSCTGTVSGSAVVTVRPPVPTLVSATAVSTTRVNLTWQFSGIAERFDVRRNGVLIGNTAVPSYADLTAQPNTTYWYDVSAVNAGTASASSARDLATTYLFATPNILPNSFIKATHLMETRSAVNIARAAAGLPPATFTDSNLANLRPKAVHISELRTALDEARARLGVPPMAYVQSSVVAGSTLVAAVDVMELRRGVE